MCVGIPMRILSVDGIAATATDGHDVSRIDLSLVGDVPVGAWVLTFLGTAHEVIDEAQAALISAALDGLRRIMAGGEAGDAFADLDARTPELPPHLQAALDAGHSQG
ncbi:MAG: HypC/HybG/HupF family hydrogenase formation chaperone [Proteobacteria bacterium]|nr:HypC/HybG/HupF family hydrogenase formation chaperone [Pseudomonadota bacterium]